MVRSYNARPMITPSIPESLTAFNLTIPRQARDQKIIVEFRFLSDSDDAVGAGWYVDDLVIDR